MLATIDPRSHLAPLRGRLLLVPRILFRRFLLLLLTPRTLRTKQDRTRTKHQGAPEPIAPSAKIQALGEKNASRTSIGANLRASVFLPIPGRGARQELEPSKRLGRYTLPEGTTNQPIEGALGKVRVERSRVPAVP